MIHTESKPMDQLHSLLNRLFFTLRKKLKFHRKGYSESCPQIEHPIDFKPYILRHSDSLSEYSLRKNKQTLDWLDRAFENIQLSHIKMVTDAGCQDFIRLPAYRAFFKHHQSTPTITGIEVDAYPILNNFYSRWDKAQYYISLDALPAQYIVGDYFTESKKTDVLFVFYPFLTAHPTLKWGLPLDYSAGQKWMDCIITTTHRQSWILLSHHNINEQNIFDELRKNQPLQLKKRFMTPNILMDASTSSYLSLYQRL